MKRESNLQLLAVLTCVVTLMCSACASLQSAGRELLPVVDAEPIEQNTSNYAEGAWLVLDSMDTYETMRFHSAGCVERDPFAAKIYGTDTPPPGRVLGINVALMLAHTMVTAWLDDEVAAHDAKNDGSAGPWYIGRVVWHAGSLIATGSSVVSNKLKGCG